MPNTVHSTSLDIETPTAATPVQTWVARVSALLLHTVEAVSALLVVAEILILSGGVISRYVFDAPLLWSDELARFLFLWLSMLGAVVALRRGEHMRLSVLVNRASPGVRRWAE